MGAEDDRGGAMSDDQDPVNERDDGDGPYVLPTEFVDDDDETCDLTVNEEDIANDP